MTKELFCEILGDAREDFVLEAWGAQNSQRLGHRITKPDAVGEQAVNNVAKSRSQIRGWIFRWGIAAAVLCLVAGSGMLYRMSHEVVPADPDLPILAITELRAEGMGFEGLIYQNASEVSEANHSPLAQDMTTLSDSPSDKGNVGILPVYKNEGYALNEKAVPLPSGLDTDAMVERLEKVAAIIGIEASDWKPVSQSKKVYRVYAEADRVRIEVDADGAIRIEFKDGLELPAQYHFTPAESTEEEMKTAIAYLADRYSALLDFVQPEFIVEWDRDIYGERGCDYKVYDGAGDVADKLLNYCFHYAEFVPNDAGKLWIIRVCDQLAAAEKIGDYPIITMEEAKQELLAGEYLTTVPYPVSGEDAVVMGELVYRSGYTEKNYLPYYRFYAELPEDIFEMQGTAEGLKIYGAYYVPAVSRDYISRDYISTKYIPGDNLPNLPFQ